MRIGLGTGHTMLYSLPEKSCHSVIIPIIFIQSMHPSDHDVTATVFSFGRNFNNAVVLCIFSRGHGVILHFHDVARRQLLDIMCVCNNMIIDKKCHRLSFYSCLIGYGINVQLWYCHVSKQVISVDRHFLLQRCRDIDVLVHFMNFSTRFNNNLIEFHLPAYRIGSYSILFTSNFLHMCLHSTYTSRYRCKQQHKPKYSVRMKDFQHLCLLKYCTIFTLTTQI